MQRITIGVLLIMAFSTSVAQQYPTPYAQATSSAPSTLTYFNFDISDSLYIDGATSEIFYRDQPGTSWSSAPMDLLYQTCTTFTYSGSTGYQPPSDMLEWYFRSYNDTAVVTQSPKNTDGLFPVPAYLLADLGDDPSGDQEGGGGNNVDIIHCYASYSDTKLYVRIDNNGGGFPTSSGLFTYYMYLVGLVNPNAADSVAYALMYASNILYSSGLYALDLSDSSLTQIGSISTNVAGNSLSMSCNLSDLVAQPGWPAWPPEAGFIGIAPVTATAVLTDIGYNDFGKTGLFIPSSHLLDFAAANTTPTLTDPSVIADDTGLVTAELTYTDADNHLAAVRTLHFGGAPYDMVACEKDYAGGAPFGTSLSVTESGWYSYYFEFSDGAEVVTTPLDSVYVDLFTFLCGDADGNGVGPDIADLVYLVNFMFNGGPEPPVMAACDVDGNGVGPDIADLVYLVNFMFNGGPALQCP
ncbi:MAG: hypothetical protein ABIE70_10415 [bacterium]